MKRKRRIYWYFFYHTECPQCGRLKDYKERRYTPKPKRARNRHEYKQQWDTCGCGL